MATLTAPTSARRSPAPTRPRASAPPPAGFHAYAAAAEAGGAPLLGHLVVYSVFDCRVKPSKLERWFTELDLDRDYLPRPIKPIDAFKKVTGNTGLRITYPLDPLTGHASDPAAARGRREATLMVRHVRNDDRHIVRHLVREIRDETRTELHYDTHLAEIVFERDIRTGAAPGAGTLRVHPDHAGIARLPETEQNRVHEMLGKLKAAYRERCMHLTGDHMRYLLRTYIEQHLGAVRVRDTGGVYFVHRAHADTLTALRELVARMGTGSKLNRVPILDQDEMREMIIDSVTRQVTHDLDLLTREIAAAHHDGASDKKKQALLHRYEELKSARDQHAQLLSTSLTDSDTAFNLAGQHLADLLRA